MQSNTISELYIRSGMDHVYASHAGTTNSRYTASCTLLFIKTQHCSLFAGDDSYISSDACYQILSCACILMYN